MAHDVSRTLHYRHVEFLTPSALTLQQLLEQALQGSPLAVNRERALGDEVFQILNTHTAHGSARCGSLHRWVHGQNQLIVERDLAAATWRITEVAPPPSAAQATAGGQAPVRDFLPFSLYFGVRDNHIVVLQTQGMMAPELGQYLTWFFRTKLPQVFPANQAVVLYPASATMLRARGVDTAKAVIVTKPLADLHARPPEGRKRKPWYEKIVPRVRANAVADILSALGINVPAALLNQPGAKDLEVRFEISRPRGKEPLGNPVMNEIGRIAAQQGSDEFTIELLDGSELTGADLKLSQVITLTVADGRTHPAEADIFRKIAGYLQHLLVSGMV